MIASEKATVETPTGRIISVQKNGGAKTLHTDETATPDSVPAEYVKTERTIDREKGDIKTANKVLENIAKLLGYYEKHNKQKLDITPAEAEAIRERLKERGVNFEMLGDRSEN